MDVGRGKAIKKVGYLMILFSHKVVRNNAKIL